MLKKTMLRGSPMLKGRYEGIKIQGRMLHIAMRFANRAAKKVVKTVVTFTFRGSAN